jgi:outer membrane protein assembly factor BamB
LRGHCFFLRYQVTGAVFSTRVHRSDGLLVVNSPKRPSPILSGDNLYMIDDSGVATCLDATTAKVLWQARVGGNYRSSPLLADGKIYFFELEGKVTVIEASTEGKKVLAENQLDNGFQASPAVAGNSLFLCSTKHLNCFSNE